MLLKSFPTSKPTSIFSLTQKKELIIWILESYGFTATQFEIDLKFEFEVKVAFFRRLILQKMQEEIFLMLRVD